MRLKKAYLRYWARYVPLFVNQMSFNILIEYSHLAGEFLINLGRKQVVCRHCSATTPRGEEEPLGEGGEVTQPQLPMKRAKQGAGYFIAF